MPGLIPTYGSGAYLRGASLIEYARGAGGRVDALPGRYLDMIAEAVVTCHPEYVVPRLRELLVCGKFRRSTHPRLRDVTLAELRRLACDERRRTYERRGKLHGDAFLAGERERKRRTPKTVVQST